MYALPHDLHIAKRHHQLTVSKRITVGVEILAVVVEAAYGVDA